MNRVLLFVSIAAAALLLAAAPDAAVAADKQSRSSCVGRGSSKKALLDSSRGKGRMRTHLAAVTTYWQRGSGVDRWTRRGVTATGRPLRRGVVAVDPHVIPFGSTVKLDGVPGTFLAADTGGAVISRRAARRTGRTAAERSAIVIDVFFPTEREARAFDARIPRFVRVHHYPPARG